MSNLQTVSVGGCWPTEMQEWLLQAAVLDGPLALDAWSKWSSNIDFENMDHASERLIPLLNHNLQRLKIVHSLSGRFQGLYRQSWVRSSLISKTGREVLRGLSEAGIESLLLKGAAFSLLYYESQALRPMADLDILVPIQQSQLALDYLRENEWKVSTKNFVALSEDYLRTHNGITLKQPGKCEIDLHWHALHEGLSSGDDDAFWHTSKSLVAYGEQTKTLSDADHLFHCCVHGLRWNSLSPIRWTADAHVIISNAPDLDWRLLIERAENKQLVLTLRNALHYLSDTLESPIPDFVLKGLDAIEVSRDEVREFQIKTKPRGALGRLPSIVCLFKRQHQKNQNIFVHSWLLINFVKRYWRAEGEGNLFFAVITKSARWAKTRFM